MEDFNFSEYLENSTTSYPGSYYVENYDITIPLRLYNYAKDKKFKNLDDFYQYLTILFENYTSRYLFPGDLVCFYPSIRESKASKPISCHISGAKIVENELYYSYRPLLDNLTSGKVYTIQHTLKVSIGYYDCLPQTLGQFEELCSNFQLGLSSENVDYYDFQVNAGDNALHLKKLSKKKGF